MRFFNSLKRITNLSREIVDYIKRYQITYNRLIKEAKERENDRLVMRAKIKTKAMWQILNTEIGNSIHHDYKTDLRNGDEIISNLQNVLDTLNSFYVETANNLLNLNNNCINVYTSQQKIDYCLNTVFCLSCH